MPQIFLKTASGALSGSTPDHSLTDFVNKVRESHSYSVNKCRLVQEAVGIFLSCCVFLRLRQ